MAPELAATPRPDESSVEQPQYVVRVAPDVLATIVRRAVQQVPGVVRLAEAMPRRSLLPGGASYARNGVRLAVRAGHAHIAVYLVIARGQNLQAVGASVQAAVAQALEQLVGLPVERIDVYLQDVVS